MLYRIIHILTLLLVALHVTIDAQCNTKNFFTPSDTFCKKRYLLATGFSGLSYGAFSIGLYQAWYSKYELTKFHTFNDWKEWKSMDKFGHVYSSYIQSNLVYNGAQWTGLSNRKAMFHALSLSCLFQTTIELFDGYNERWGFSWTDIGANIAGNSLFFAQECFWNEQKFQFKFSSHQSRYGQSNQDLEDRIHSLYGTNALEHLLKDYNGQTYWLSFHPVSSFTNLKTIWPTYLNVAVGYGVSGLFGGSSNSWLNSQSVPIHLSSSDFPRYNQYYLSLDINLQKIPVKSPFLKTIFSVLNIIKFPSPTLEINSLRKVKFHYFLF